MAGSTELREPQAAGPRNDRKGGSNVEPVRLTNEVPVPTVPQPQGTEGPNEAEAAELAALQKEAQDEDGTEEG